MPETRSSARHENCPGATDHQANDADSKRKAADEALNPASTKRGRHSNDSSGLVQKTLEQTMTKDPSKTVSPPVYKSKDNAEDCQQVGEHSIGNDNKDENNGEVDERAVEGESAVVVDEQREKALPRNVLEKGLIYWFTRGRVNVDDPKGVEDLARSYFVLRPLPPGAKLTEGPIPDVSNNRLFELPKKVWPKSAKDRFMTFVAKTKTSIQTLKEEFFSGNEYDTKTVGVRHTPPVKPVGEGVYIIVRTGGGQGTSHLAYMLTIPSKPSEVQERLGIGRKGSFIISVKNPQSGGPANAQLPQSAEFPDDMLEEFAGRAWGPAEPKHLDHVNAQILLIGEGLGSGDDLAGEHAEDAGQERNEAPREELERLEQEDLSRVEQLAGDDSVFHDLNLSSDEYSKVQTTW